MSPRSPLPGWPPRAPGATCGADGGKMRAHVSVTPGMGARRRAVRVGGRVGTGVGAGTESRRAVARPSPSAEGRRGACRTGRTAAAATGREAGKRPRGAGSRRGAHQGGPRADRPVRHGLTRPGRAGLQADVGPHRRVPVERQDDRVGGGRVSEGRDKRRQASTHQQEARAYSGCRRWEVQLLGDPCFGPGTGDLVLESATPLAPTFPAAC